MNPTEEPPVNLQVFQHLPCGSATRSAGPTWHRFNRTSTFLFFFLILTQGSVFNFFERETSILYVPRPGMEPAAFRCMGQCLNQLSRPAGPPAPFLMALGQVLLLHLEGAHPELSPALHLYHANNSLPRTLMFKQVLGTNDRQ